MSIIHDGSHSVTFISGDPNASYDLRRSWLDFHIVPEKPPAIPPRILKYNIVDIPFTSRSKDYTQTIVQDLIFDPVNGEWTFHIDHDKWTSWYDCKSALENFINGKRLYCVLEDDHQLKYRGRFTISNWEDGSDYSKVTISYDIDGYHWNNDFVYDVNDVYSDTISDSWDEIYKNIKNGSYSRKYHLYDIKNVPYGNEYGNIPMQIVAFDADIDSSSGGTIPITWLSREILIRPSKMYDSNIDTQYWQTNINAICESLYNHFPNNVKRCIKSSIKYFYHPTYLDAATYSKIWIPSYREIYGGNDYEVHGPSYSSVFTSRARCIHGKVSAGGTSWWLRTRKNESYSNNYLFVAGSGNQFDASPTTSMGIVIGFCT